MAGPRAGASTYPVQPGTGRPAALPLVAGRAFSRHGDAAPERPARATVLALNRPPPSARPALRHEPDRAQPAPDFCASRRWRVRRHGCQNPAPSAASRRPLNPVHSKASEVRGRRTLSPALLPADLLLRRVPAAATGPAHRSAPTNSATRCPPAPRRSRRADLSVTAHRTGPARACRGRQATRSAYRRDRAATARRSGADPTR
jgi:hypothetical protein